MCFSVFRGPRGWQGGRGSGAISSAMLFCVLSALHLLVPERCPKASDLDPKVNYGVFTSLLLTYPFLLLFFSVALSRTPWLRKIGLPLSLNFHIFGGEGPKNFLDLWNHHYSFWGMEQSQEWTGLSFTQNTISLLDSKFGGLLNQVISISVFGAISPLRWGFWFPWSFCS